MTAREEQEEYERLATAHATWKATPESQRDAWLTRLERQDHELARELGELLSASLAAPSLFTDAAIDRRGGLPYPGLAPAEDVDGELPETIGPYRILGLLGSGGMGVVYSAQQAHPSRHVAVKLIRAEMARGTRLRRFRHEAEAQGRLKHPGIAQVYDTGVCDLGFGEQPYLVLELIEGEGLLAYARREQLDTRAKLERLAQLCGAVQHAHQHGVVHRDLKPDNVLVDREGQPKILDFGIARVTAEEGTPLTTIHTAHGDIVGTLTHVAPEQLLGDPEAVGPAADVYALGVIAFELLTERLPHEVAGLRFTEAVRQVTEQAAPRLGTLDRSLRGDIETMVGKALEQEPNRRYVSAAAFGTDLRRFLAYLPIAARRPSLAYRASRFVRRHRGLTFGLVLSLFTLLGGLAAVLKYAKQEGDARLQSEQLALRAQLASNTSAAGTIDQGAVWSARDLLQQLPLELRGWEWEWLLARTPLVIPGLDPQFLAWNGHHLAAMEDVRPLREPKQSFARRVAVASLLDSGVSLRPVEGLSSYEKLSPEYRFIDGKRQPGGAAVVLGQMSKPGGGGALEYGIGLLDIPSASFAERFRIGTPSLPGLEATAPKPGVFFNGRLIRGRSEYWHWRAVEFGQLVPGQAWTPEPLPVDYPTANECRVDPTETYALVLPHRNESGPRVVLELAGWRELGRLPPPRADERLNNAVFGPDGSELALLSAEDRVDFYQLPSLEHKRSLSVPPSTNLYWIQADRLLLGARSYIRLIDAGTGTVLEEHPTNSSRGVVQRHPVWPLFAHPGGRDEEVTISHLGVSKAPAYRELVGHTSWIYPCAISPDGSLIASSAPSDPHVHLWDAWSGELLARLPRGLLPRPGQPWTSHIAPLFFSEDGNRLATTEPFEGGIRIVRYDLLTGDEERSPRHPDPFDWPVCRPELLEELISGMGDLSGRNLGPRLLGYLKERQLITAQTLLMSDRSSMSKSTKIREPYQDDQVLAVGNTLGVSMSPDRKYLAIGEVGKVRILELPSGRLLATALDEGNQVPDFYAVAWSPEGSRLAVGDSTGRVRILETRYFLPVLELPSHDDYVFSLAWSPDGTRLVSASGDKTLRVYDSVHSIARFAQGKERQKHVQQQRDLLQSLTRELGDAGAAAHELLRRAGQDPAKQQAARRAALLAWAGSTNETR